MQGRRVGVKPGVCAAMGSQNKFNDLKLTVVVASMLAPYLTRLSTQDRFPLRDAKCRGVQSCLDRWSTSA